MTWKEKLAKAGKREFLHSLKRGLLRACLPVSNRELLQKIDSERVERLIEQHGIDRRMLRERQGYLDPRKYCHVAHFLDVSRKEALGLGLHLTPHSRRILDLGSGAGFFGFVCRELGHECLNLDRKGNPIFAEFFELLGLERVLYQIEPFRPLPRLGGRFDLVTAHAICFDRLPDGSRWGEEEWRFFLGHLEAAHLKPGGRIVLKMNRDEERGGFFRPEIAEAFTAHRFRIAGSRAEFRDSRRRGRDAKKPSTGWEIPAVPRMIDSK